MVQGDTRRAGELMAFIVGRAHSGDSAAADLLASVAGGRRFGSRAEVAEAVLRAVEFAAAAGDAWAVDLLRAAEGSADRFEGAACRAAGVEGRCSGVGRRRRGWSRRWRR